MNVKSILARMDAIDKTPNADGDTKWRLLRELIKTESEDCNSCNGKGFIGERLKFYCRSCNATWISAKCNICNQELSIDHLTGYYYCSNGLCGK